MPSPETAHPLVLVVEDDLETRYLYREVLTLAGFETDEAHNGLQAFDKAVAGAPHLIVTDIVVPGIDGLELCRRLRADSRTSHIPLLAVTGYDGRAYYSRALEAGADGVLFKPFEADILLAEARRLIAREVPVEKPSLG